MSDIFDQWDSQYDASQIASDVENNKGGDYPEIPSGDYEVSVEKAELKATAKGNPMVSIWFKILNGEYKNQKLFYNQVISADPNKAYYGIHSACEFMRSLQTGVDVKFTPKGGFKEWSNAILDVAEYAQNKEYHLVYENVKDGFDKYEIAEVLSSGEGDVPF